MAIMTPITVQKRQQLLELIDRLLKPRATIEAVIGIGSIALGTMRQDSDIDAIVLFDRFDPYIVPAEFVWMPADNSFHSIFSRDPQVQAHGWQFDLVRRQFDEWSSPSRLWLDGERAELSECWVAFDRHEQVSPLIKAFTHFGEPLRQARLDEALIWLDQHLKWAGAPQEIWDSLGPIVAQDRLHAAYDYLAQALFAYNRRWRPWRNREMSYLLRLPWLPDHFQEEILSALNAPSHDYSGYVTRFQALEHLFTELLARLIQDGDYGEEDPVGEAFVRSNDEPGRAWNMNEWNQHHSRI